jgi:hypothetical protein
MLRRSGRRKATSFGGGLVDLFTAPRARLDELA